MRFAAVCVLSTAVCQACLAQDSRYSGSSTDIPPFGAQQAEPSGGSPAGISSAFGDSPSYGRNSNDLGASARPPLPATQSPPTASPQARQNTYPQNPPGAAASAPSSSRAYQPTELMSGMFRAPNGSRLTGRPVRMEEVVASGENRAEQTQRINAYWDLCSSVADYYLGLAEATELNRQAQQSGGQDPAISQAAARWSTRNGTSLLAAVAAQRRLASMMGTSTLPMPGDPPLCGRYETLYEQVFAGRSSEEAHELDQLIALRYEELVAAAAEVSSSQQFVQQVSQRQPPNAQATIKALQLLALHRRAFVQIAKDYNRQITRYTELSRPGKIDTSRLVAMLVERPRTASNSSSSSNAGTKPLTFRSPR